MRAESPYREGWGVAICPIWASDDDGEPLDAVADIEVSVVRLGPTTERIVGGAICAEAWPGLYVPMENFKRLEDLRHDDTHDLRDRWFATETEARDHAAHTQRRWERPQPWESFIQV